MKASIYRRMRGEHIVALHSGRKGWVPALVLFMGALAYPAASQTTGTCPRAQGEAYLDVGNVRARILNNGGLFYRGEPHVYEVPKGSGVHALFTSTILVSGVIDGEIHTAATRYGEWEFWPGPLDDHGNPPDDCAPFDRLWEITRDDLITYAQTGIPTDNLRDWPWQLGAPVLDGDGIGDNYNLDGGDLPALLGDQMLWWVMNDRGNTHESTDGPPIGMEVHASAFAFQQPRSPIGTTTFYRYVLRYKGHHPFEDAYFGLYSDPDLGNFDDDYIGSDTTLHLAYTYNADNNDEGNYGYGVAPPAIGYTFLRTAVADADGRDNDRDGIVDEPGEMRGMTSFMSYPGGGCVICDPVSARDYYYYMQAVWKDGRPITFGGNGRDFSEIPVQFIFPGDPVTGEGWSEINWAGDGSQTPVDPADRRFVTASGPFTMQPGDEQEILFAIVWARGTDHLDSVSELKRATARLHKVADDILQVDVSTFLPEPPPEPAPVLGFARNYPNPFSETTTIRYSLPQPMYVRLRVFDVLGRAVATLVDEQQEGGIHDVPFGAVGLPAGVYVYRIEMDHLTFTRRMTLVR